MSSGAAVRCSTFRSAPTANARPPEARRNPERTSPDPQPMSRMLGRGEPERKGRTAAVKARRFPSQRSTKRRSARLRSASSSGTPSSSNSLSVERRARSITATDARSHEFQQREFRAEAGAKGAQQAALAGARAISAQDLVQHEKDRHGAHVAVLGEDGLRRRQIAIIKAEALRHDLDDPAPAG